VKSSFVQSNFLRWLLLMLLTLSISACAGAGSNRLVAEGKIATSLSSVGHYGKGIGISEFYVNGTWGGNQHGWGGGGSSVLRESATYDQQLHLGDGEMEDLSHGSHGGAMA
jgi:hypothetical protein